MINLTLTPICKKTDKELDEAIVSAIVKTRRVLFETHSDGREVPVEQITSTSHRVPRTLNLAFCKFYSSRNLDDCELSGKEFVEQCYEIYMTKNGLHKKEAFAKIIPDYTSIENQLSAIFMNEIKKGLGLMLMSLWQQDAVVLCSNFRMPKTTIGNRGPVVRLGSHFFSEVISFLEQFRGNALNKSTSNQSETKSLAPSVQSSLLAYGWKMILSTDWHRIEDVCIDEATQYLNALNKKDEFVNYPVPVRVIMYLLKDNFPERARYSKEEFDIKRALDIQEKSLILDSNFHDKVPYRQFSPTILSQGVVVNIVDGFNINKAASVWVDYQCRYLKMKRKKYETSDKSLIHALSVLNYFLFVVLARYETQDSKADIVPIKPKDFTRRFLDGDDSLPSLISFISEGRTNETAYIILQKIDGFFEFLQLYSAVDPNIESFKNPIYRQVDFPLVKQRRGTNKSIVSQTNLPAMLGYLYAIEQFVWHLTESCLSNEKNIIEKLSKLPSTYDYFINTEEFGLVPFIVHRNKVWPIYKVHKSLLTLSYRRIKNIGSVPLPNLTYLYQTLVAFETGLRSKHIQWLDSRTFDKYIENDDEEKNVCQLLVNTDKVKNKPWTPVVSQRVIKLLKKLKAMRLVYDEPWTNKTYWYGGNSNSRFKKISPLFAIGGDSPSHGKPHENSTYNFHFKKLLFSFQHFANENNLFDKPIKWVKFKEKRDSKGKLSRSYSSRITPHSARATVVSHRILMLPLWVIGNYITGHESDAVVAYYAVPDEDYLNKLGLDQKQSVFGSASLLDNANQSEFIRAEQNNSSLRQALDINKSDTFLDFGALSFEQENHEGEIESGLSIVKTSNTDQVAHNSTHLCPFNNNCPKEVIIEIGEKQCGQCWASIKTVDHLPRILSHIRMLHAKKQELTNHVQFLIEHKSSNSVVEHYDEIRLKVASEESAWIATHTILEKFRLDSMTRDNYLVMKPEIVEKQLLSVATDNSPLTNLLLRVREAKEYPEYFTPQLKASITNLRNQLLIKSGYYEQLINQPDDFKLLDEFRGMVRSICDSTGYSIRDLSESLATELPSGNMLMLEMI